MPHPTPDAQPRLRGVVPIIPTPFRAGSEEVDPGALAGLVNFAVDAGAAAICLPAYASEFYKLTEAERLLAVQEAVRHARGRVPVIAQSNHPSAKAAAGLARRHVDLGADLISFAIPRLFALGPDDLLAYCATICKAVSVPILIQDFNPNGPTVGAEFCARLVEMCPNFAYIKLEEPLMGDKVAAIRAATGDAVGVLEGWGGLYMLELASQGICGIMPGLGLADVLAHIWQQAQAGQMGAAMDLFEQVAPQLMFSLQNMELFHHVEKRLLARRGVLADATVRQATFTPNAHLLAYGDFLNERAARAAETLKAAAA
ncbi:MAG: dihydrodipicolinate synthase family protein [Caldilineaceae bacterium]|nr:dihydrodipicolinate synthase family protein [Caldilineaceae bacterium]